jgi:short-subunit dehydrogenase involved in D-alanine esterification of teichoic acids
MSSSGMAAQNNSESEQAQKPLIVITGANRGLGLALAETFSSSSFTVIATARKPDEAIELKKLEYNWKTSIFQVSKVSTRLPLSSQVSQLNFCLTMQEFAGILPAVFLNLKSINWPLYWMSAP